MNSFEQGFISTYMARGFTKAAASNALALLKKFRPDEIVAQSGRFRPAVENMFASAGNRGYAHTDVLDAISGLRAKVTDPKGTIGRRSMAWDTPNKALASTYTPAERMMADMNASSVDASGMGTRGLARAANKLRRGS